MVEGGGCQQRGVVAILIVSEVVVVWRGECAWVAIFGKAYYHTYI